MHKSSIGLNIVSVTNKAASSAFSEFANGPQRSRLSSRSGGFLPKSSRTSPAWLRTTLRPLSEDLHGSTPSKTDRNRYFGGEGSGRLRSEGAHEERVFGKSESCKTVANHRQPFSIGSTRKYYGFRLGQKWDVDTVMYPRLEL